MSYQQAILDLQKQDSIPKVYTEELMDGSVILPGVIVTFYTTVPGTATREMIDRTILSISDLESASIEMPKLKLEPTLTEEVVELVKVPRENAISLIKSYIDSHQGCRTGDIIYDLGLDPELVLDVLRELEDKGEVRGEDIE